MQLSVIIVSYNVKYFLEQCLSSVQSAMKNIEGEVIIVDNNSTDNSVTYLTSRFPGSKIIANSFNAGFAKACNQGLKIASGKYILFLNPDTIIPEDCFSSCIEIFKSNTETGAIGVRMIDGSGKFLRESKRAFPAPLTAFYKLIGLAALFPGSRVFARYHLGYLSEDQTNSVDVLAGAFMMIRKDILDQIGGFDETFFMYGEDIDLSYRIQQAGYSNIYFPKTTIIHFKGESTRKTSVNYVKMFYNAMSIFVRKHYRGSSAGIFTLFIHLAIWFRAGIAAVGGFFRHTRHGLIDLLIIVLSIWLALEISKSPFDKLSFSTYPYLAIYPATYLLVAWYAGVYDRGTRLMNTVISSLLAGMIFFAIAKLVTPESWSSLIAIIPIAGFLLVSSIHLLFFLTGFRKKPGKPDERRIVVVASEHDYEETISLLKETGHEKRVIGRFAPEGLKSNTHRALPDGTTEIIFAKGELTFKEIVQDLGNLPQKVLIKIHTVGTDSIVGSDSKDRTGESVSIEQMFKLSSPFNRRLKRLIDVALAIAGIIFFPVHLFFIKNPFRFLKNSWNVLIGRKTWIGYAVSNKQNLPHLRTAIFASNGIFLKSPDNKPVESLEMIDYWYARDYKISNDIRLILKLYRQLGGY